MALSAKRRLNLQGELNFYRWIESSGGRLTNEQQARRNRIIHLLTPRRRLLYLTGWILKDGAVVVDSIWRDEPLAKNRIAVLCDQGLSGMTYWPQPLNG